MTSQKHRRINEKRREAYHKKIKQKKVSTVPQKSSPVPNPAVQAAENSRSSQARRSALYRAKSALPQSPTRFARTMTDLLQKATPPHHALVHTGILPQTPARFDHKISSALKQLFINLSGKGKKRSAEVKGEASVQRDVSFEEVQNAA